MNRQTAIVACLLYCGLGIVSFGFGAQCQSAIRNRQSTNLEAGWSDPPNAARLRAYWWWLNGNVDKAGITRDLEEMKAKGFGGALLCDAGGADQRDNTPVPAGPTFFSDQWRELYRHALREAHRLGLEVSLNILSGWNVGGPMVTPEDAVKKLVWSEVVMTGPGPITVQTKDFSPIQIRDGFYRDLFVLAFPIESGAAPHKPLKNWRIKALYDPTTFTRPNGWFLTNSSPDTSALFEEEPDMVGEEDTKASAVIDLSDHLDPNGTLMWDAPEGKWQILRFGCTLADNCTVSTHSDGWGGYALDVLDAGAFARYWDAVVEPLIADAGPLAGTTLRYLYTDSWEIDVFNWTPTFRDEFRTRRGYDPLPYFPVLAGRIVGSRDVSNRFLADYRKTLGDLAVDHHYRLFREWAARAGIGIHPESGGPHYMPIDAQRCLGMDDVPMSEFWASSPSHRTDEVVRFFVKQPAGAAHTYGHRFVAAEGMTNIGLHWQESLWSNLKPAFDYACSEGLNRLFWHAFVCSPASMGVPGQQYFAGAHLNPLVTWWSRSKPFFNYINRCQWMLMQGLFVADVCYYYGDHVPNYAQLRASDPAKVGPGYDYDVTTEEAILTRLSVDDGRLTLPDGMSYRLLVLPAREVISLPVLRKIQELVEAGATVVGPKPLYASGLTGFPESDAQVCAIADVLWGAHTGKGRVISDLTAREVLASDAIPPDFELTNDADENARIHWIHRRDGDTDIYFVATRSEQSRSIRATFRVAGRAPELWDPVSGQRRFATDYEEANGRVTVPLELSPYGSVFVVFCSACTEHPPAGEPDGKHIETCLALAGPWTVHFGPNWAGPESVEFSDLISWTQRTEEGIRFYSGTATYEKTFELPNSASGQAVFLDLGRVRELAEVRLNGVSLGIVWAPPFRVELTRAVKSGENHLEVDVVNFWPNRLIGDASRPRDQRLTQTNIRAFTSRSPLMESGLLGPVILQVAQ
jgi:hypothetical protein